MSPRDIYATVCMWECEKNQRCRKADGCSVICACPSYVTKLRRHFGLTHTQEQALVLLDGAQATEKACHHDDGSDADDHVGG